MRIKILVLGLIYLFMSLFLFCMQVDFANFTSEDAANYIEKSLRRIYDFRVTADLKEGRINFALKGTFTTIAFLLGLVFLGTAFFCPFWIKERKKEKRLRRIEVRRPPASEGC